MLNRWNPFEMSNGAVALGPLMAKEFDQLFRELSVRQGNARELVPAARRCDAASDSGALPGSPRKWRVACNARNRRV